MNGKDLRLGLVALAAALWALWPSWLDPRLSPANFGDLFTFHQPMRHLAAEALQQGRLPFWNPYIFSGLPLLANPQAALFYPVSALGFVLPLTPALSWDFLLHLCWAMLGVALLVRQARLPAAAAWTAALLYALSPFLIFRVTEGIPTLLAALAWAPWCWLAWASGRYGWLGLVWALQLLSGHGQFLIVNAAGMGLWALVSPRRLRRLAVLLREGLWALALTAAQWEPTREFLALSVRRSWPRAYALGYSLDWASLSSLWSPSAAGDPLRGGWAGPPSVFFETRALCVGLAGLALAIYGLSLKRRRAATLALLAAGVLLALGANSPVYRAAEPLLASLRTPSRWLLLSLWALTLAAAAGAARLARLPRRGAAAAAAAFLVVLVELGARDARYLSAAPAQPFVRPSASFAEAFGGQPFRLVTSPGLANPNKTAYYHALNANGYDAFYLDGYPQYAARAQGAPAADGSRVFMTRLGSPELERLGVAYRINADGTRELDRRALPLAFFTDAAGKPSGAPPVLSLEGPELWTVRGFWPQGAARLVLSQPLYPGWRAWLDGKPAALSLYDGLLQSVARAGDLKRFELDARFTPTLWPALVIATLLAWGAWAAAAGWGVVW
jgi:hypothetical protein